MIYQLQANWPVGAAVIPSGTVINTARSDDWSVLARGRMPPADAIVLDEEAYRALLKLYPAEKIRTGGGIIRVEDFRASFK